MRKAEQEHWILNLENLISSIDIEIVDFICKKYGADDIYMLHPRYYSEVFSELFQFAFDTIE